MTERVAVSDTFLSAMPRKLHHSCYCYCGAIFNSSWHCSNGPGCPKLLLGDGRWDAALSLLDKHNALISHWYPNIDLPAIRKHVEENRVDRADVEQAIEAVSMRVKTSGEPSSIPDVPAASWASPAVIPSVLRLQYKDGDPYEPLQVSIYLSFTVHDSTPIVAMRVKGNSMRRPGSSVRSSWSGWHGTWSWSTPTHPPRAACGPTRHITNSVLLVDCNWIG